MKGLIGFRIKSIQAWIMAGGRLRDLAGGSLLVERLVRDDGANGSALSQALGACKLRLAMPGAPDGGRDGRVLMAAAGGFRLLVEESGSPGVRAFCRLWPLMAEEWLPGIATAFALHVIAGDTPTSGDLDALGERLRQEGNRPLGDLVLAAPLAHRADRSGLAAVCMDHYESSDPGDRDEAVDLPTKRRRRTYRERLRGMQEPSPFVRKLYPAAVERSDFALEMEDIVAEGANSTFALIHADANSMGDTFLRLAEDGAPAALHAALSQKLAEAIEAAAAGAFQFVFPNPGKFDRKTRIPARPVVLGGDDMTVIVPARHGVAFAYYFLQGFESFMGKVIQQLARDFPDYPVRRDRITACAGVALVHSHYPFDLAHELADELCRSAKKKTGREVSALAFHRVTESIARPYHDIVKHELTVPGGAERLSLTRGPYVVGDKSWDDFPLNRLFRGATKLPRGAWAGLAHACEHGRAESDNAFRRMMENAARGETSAAASAIKEALRAMRMHVDSGDTVWRKAGEGWETPILDVAALLGAERVLVPGEENEREAAE